jgi:hypothetical protein
MSVEPPAGPDSEQLALEWQVDAVCLRFEAAWQAGQRPGIEDYLADAQEPLRSALLRELLKLDIEYRQKAGESPSPEDYRDRFPDLDPVWLASTVVVPPGGGATTPGATPLANGRRAAPADAGDVGGQADLGAGAGQHHRPTPRRQRPADGGEAPGRPAPLGHAGPRVKAHVLPGPKFPRARDLGQGAVILGPQRELQVLAANRKAEVFNQLQQPAHLQAVGRPGQEQLGVGTIIARQVEAGGPAGAEQDHEWVDERAAAVQLDGEVELLGL